MFPEEFIKRINSQKLIDPVSLLASLSTPEPASIRLNPSKWRHHPVGAQQVSWCNDGWYLDTRPSYTLDPLFHSGCYYPQEASGMFLEKVFNDVCNKPKKIKVLDLCGAPGGKSTHLSTLIGKEGLLVANEPIRQRASILAETLTKWGTGNTIVTHNDPAHFERLGGYFDVIVVDAPCSGEGMFRNPVAVDEWSTLNAAHCSERQKRILMDIWPALKENGILIYSTCTFNPDENEKNVRWLLDKKKAESIKLDIPDLNGVVEIDYKGIRGYGFYPDKIRGNGLFISVIRKSEAAYEITPGHPGKSDLLISNKEISRINEWTNFSPWNLFRTGDNIFGVVCDPDNLFFIRKNLRVIKAGTMVCTVKKNDYIPNHELALSDYLKKNSFPVVEFDYDKAVSYLRRDNINSPGLVKGWHIAVYKGINLGFFNNIGSRINNYFPVEWRIRMTRPETGEAKILAWENTGDV
jgi:16S rRNA C967 or C1407 C5-methylase (RsmB/RsmF family)/NOL1/NOP2/fmu family ribosome biogenesis protein